MAQNFFQQQRGFTQNFEQQQEAIGNNTATQIQEEQQNMENIKENTKEMVAQMAQEKFQGGIEALTGVGMELPAGFATVSKGLNLGKQIYGLAQTPGALTETLQKTYPGVADLLQDAKSAIQTARSTAEGARSTAESAVSGGRNALSDTIGGSKQSVLGSSFDQIRLGSKDLMGNISDDVKQSALKEHTLENWDQLNLGEKTPENISIVNRNIEGSAGDELNELTNKAVNQQNRAGFTETEGVQNIQSQVGEILQKPAIEISPFNAGNTAQYKEMSDFSATPAPESVSGEALTAENAPGLVAPVESTVADVAGDVASTAAKVGVDAGIETGLASTLEVPGLGELSAAALGVFSLVEGLKDLFDKPSAPPPPPPLQNIQQQASIGSSVQPGI